VSEAIGDAFSNGLHPITAGPNGLFLQFAAAPSLPSPAAQMRRTLVRDERATWLKESRAFRIMPSESSRAAAPARFRGTTS
jgi:hypothetical protein